MSRTCRRWQVHHRSRFIPIRIRTAGRPDARDPEEDAPGRRSLAILRRINDIDGDIVVHLTPVEITPGRISFHVLTLGPQDGLETMRIAQIAPLFESVPPKLYGGTERIVSYLTEELVRLGHDIVLFASGDSETMAELVSCSPAALRLDPEVEDPIPHYMVMLERVRRRAAGFDILHFHIDNLHYPLVRAMARPSVTTMHGRMDLLDYLPLFAEFDEMPLVSISDGQRRGVDANWVATVHHGIPKSLYRLGSGDGGYLAFLGRISPEKGVDRAIEIAKQAGIPLKIAAKIGVGDRPYFETTIAPLLDQPHVDFIGEIGEDRKQDFLGRAAAMLFPIDWPEPFGLVMIESMACGTPVIGWPCGSVPEVIDDGITGFIVDDIESAVDAVAMTASLDRHLVRRRFEKRFTAARMATDYLKVYEALTEERGGGKLPAQALLSLHAA